MAMAPIPAPVSSAGAPAPGGSSWSSLGSNALGLVGGASNLIWGWKGYDQSKDYLKLNQQALAQQGEQWNKQFEWEKYVAQNAMSLRMEDYKNSGLNPIWAALGGGSLPSAAPPSGSPHGGSGPLPGRHESFADALASTSLALRNQKESAMFDSQTASLRANAVHTLQQAQTESARRVNLRADTLGKINQAQRTGELTPLEAERLKGEIQNLDRRNKGLEIANRFAPWQLGLGIAGSFLGNVGRAALGLTGAANNSARAALAGGQARLYNHIR